MQFTSLFGHQQQSLVREIVDVDDDVVDAVHVVPQVRSVVVTVGAEAALEPLLLLALHRLVPLQVLDQRVGLVATLALVAHHGDAYKKTGLNTCRQQVGWGDHCNLPGEKTPKQPKKFILPHPVGAFVSHAISSGSSCRRRSCKTRTGTRGRWSPASCNRTVCECGDCRSLCRSSRIPRTPESRPGVLKWKLVSQRQATQLWGGVRFWGRGV